MNIDSNTQNLLIGSNTGRSRGADAARIRPCAARTSEHVRGLRINEHVQGVQNIEPASSLYPIILSNDPKIKKIK